MPWGDEDPGRLHLDRESREVVRGLTQSVIRLTSAVEELAEVILVAIPVATGPAATLVLTPGAPRAN